MKLKVALIAAVIGFSSQASFAATDTSCNPFARGSECNEVASGKSFGSYGSKLVSAFRSGNSESSLESVGRWAEAASENPRLLEMLLTLKSVFGGSSVDYAEAPDFDGGEVITVVVDDSDEDGAGEEISAVPIPASGALLIAGLGGLVAMRRKKS